MSTRETEKCQHCALPAVAIDYVEGRRHAFCEGHKPLRDHESYILRGKKLRADYVPEHSTVDGETRVIGWELVAVDGPKEYRGKGATQREALIDFRAKLAPWP